MEVWTDGSVYMEAHSAAAARFTTTTAGRTSILLPPRTAQVKCGPIACSYRCELFAILHGLQLLKGSKWKIRKVLIATDSQSAIRAIQAGPLAQRDPLNKRIWSHLRTLTHGGCHVTFQHRLQSLRTPEE